MTRRVAVAALLAACAVGPLPRAIAAAAEKAPMVLPRTAVTFDLVLCSGESVSVTPAETPMRRTHAQTTDPSVATVEKVADDQIVISAVHPGRAKARIHALVKSTDPDSRTAKDLQGYETQTYIYRITVVEDCDKKGEAAPPPRVTPFEYPLGFAPGEAPSPEPRPQASSDEKP